MCSGVAPLFLFLSMYIFLGAQGAPPPPPRLADSGGGGNRPRSILTVVHRPSVPIRQRIPIPDDLLQWDDDDSIQEILKRQSSDDYGHMRFGKRGEMQFDDYGHMRFGRGGF